MNKIILFIIALVIALVKTEMRIISKGSTCSLDCNTNKTIACTSFACFCNLNSSG